MSVLLSFLSINIWKTLIDDNRSRNLTFASSAIHKLAECIHEKVQANEKISLSFIPTITVNWYTLKYFQEILQEVEVKDFMFQQEKASSMIDRWISYTKTHQNDRILTPFSWSYYERFWLFINLKINM